MAKQLLAIINPKSGTKSKAGVPALVDKVIDKSRFDINFAEVKEEGDAQRFAEKAVAEGYYGVIAIGGDGTVNGVAAGLIGSDTALAVVPCGSGNGLGRHLNLPLKIAKALDIVNRDEVVAMDYCTVNGKPFLCTCGVGFDAKVAYEFAHAGKRGFFTYIKKSLGEYIKYKPDHYEVSIDGKKIESRAFVVSCCNAAQYGNNAFIAPHATMFDGMMDITLITPFRFYSVPILGLRLFTKTLDRNRHVHTYRGSEVVIERSDEAPMHIDGDPLKMPSRLEVKCFPKGIKVFSPGLEENHK